MSWQTGDGHKGGVVCGGCRAGTTARLCRSGVKGGRPGRYCPGAPSYHPYSSRQAGLGVNVWSVGAAGPVQQLEGVGVESRGGQAGTTLVHPPTTPIPHTLPGVGYICGLWVLPGRYNSQSKRANADCAEFVFPLYSFLLCHL